MVISFLDFQCLLFYPLAPLLWKDDFLGTVEQFVYKNSVSCDVSSCQKAGWESCLASSGGKGNVDFTMRTRIISS